MVKCSNEVKSYGGKIEAVAQKYFFDFILKNGNYHYHWDIGNEMEEAGLGRNDDCAETCIMKRLDEMMASRKDREIVE